MNCFLKSFNIVYDIVKLFLDHLRFIKIFQEILLYDNL